MAEKETKSCSEGCEEMTDNEVIKALEVCAYSDVCLKECPLFNYKADCIKRLTASALEIIKRHQSDVAPVRHGHWKEEEGWSLDDYYYTCSVCGEDYVTIDGRTPDYNFCPHCGAKMDEKECEENA